MDRVLLSLLGTRWKGWFLEYIDRAPYLICGSKFRGRNKVVVGFDQLVTGIAHRYTVWFHCFAESRVEE